MIRTAVDATAEAYWEEYFGAYGKQWVRKIPRRVATALLARTARVAASSAPDERREQVADSLRYARIAPVMAAPVITRDKVVVEGLLEVAAPKQPVVRRLFSASFDHRGTLLAIDSISVSV